MHFMFQEHFQSRSRKQIRVRAAMCNLNKESVLGSPVESIGIAATYMSYCSTVGGQFGTGAIVCDLGYYSTGQSSPCPSRSGCRARLELFYRQTSVPTLVPVSFLQCSRRNNVRILRVYVITVPSSLLILFPSSHRRSTTV